MKLGLIESDLYLLFKKDAYGRVVYFPYGMRGKGYIVDSKEKLVEIRDHHFAHLRFPSKELTRGLEISTEKNRTFTEFLAHRARAYNFLSFILCEIAALVFVALGFLGFSAGINEWKAWAIISFFALCALVGAVVLYYKIKNKFNKKLLIIEAAHDGKTQKLQALIKSGQDVNVADYDGSTPLILAAEKGHTDIVGLLLNAGADVNAQELFGETALTRACENGYEGIVMKLLDAKPDVNAANGLGFTALMRASGNGYSGIVNRLLAQEAEINAGNINGDTALTFAAGNGHTGVVTQLINNGADVNAINNNGATALIWAISHADTVDNVDAITKLLNAGIDVNITDNDGNTALTMAKSNGHKTIVDKLIAAGAM